MAARYWRLCCSNTRTSHGISLEISKSLVLNLAVDLFICFLQPELFLSMSEDDKTELVNRFWFEFYEIGIQIEHRATGTKILNVIHLEPVTFSKP
jgi:hypothetical protein